MNFQYHTNVGNFVDQVRRYDDTALIEDNQNEPQWLIFFIFIAFCTRYYLFLTGWPEVAILFRGV